MKSIRNALALSFVFVGFVALISLLQAQETSPPSADEDVSGLSDYEVEIKAIEMTLPVAATNALEFGNFYSTQHLPGTDSEWPPLPANVLGLPVWPLDDGFYLLDDRDVDYDSLLAKSKRSAIRMDSSDDIDPLDPGDGGTNIYEPNYSYTAADYGTNLWLAQVAFTNGYMTAIASNTLADVLYEVQTNADLTMTNWGTFSQFPFFYGSEETNWTPFDAILIDRNTTNLFFRLRSWADDGSGLPIWWQLQYFGYVGVDPYGDPAGDGWNNLQKFQNGWNPTLFYTPPTPQGLVAGYNSVNGMATVSWLPSPGPVTSYTLQRNYYTYPYYPNPEHESHSQTFSISAGVNNFADGLSSLHPDPSSGNLLVSYAIQANYAGGNSAWSGLVQLEQNSFSVCLVPGPQGSAVLAVSSLPAGTVALQITRIDDAATDRGDFSYNTNFNLSATTNGLYSLPNENVPPDAYYGNPLLGSTDAWYVKAIGTNGDLSVAVQVSNGFINWQDDPEHLWLAPPYFDGRIQLKQNLIFQLRAATVDNPFHYTKVSLSDGFQVAITNAPDYVYAGFYNLVFLHDPDIYLEIWLNPMQPFQNNYLYRNFVFNPAELDSGGRTTNGVFGSYVLPYEDAHFSFGYSYDYIVNDSLGVNEPANYQFQFPTVNNASIPSVLATNETRWLVSYPLDSPFFDEFNGTDYYSTYLAEIGCIDYFNLNDFTTHCQMFSGVKNIYGLPFLSAAVTAGGTPGTVSAGGTFNDDYASYFYPETAQPQFQTVEYDFWNVPLDNYDYDGTNSIPGMANFTTGRTSDLLITSVGNPDFNIAGYAKLAVLNGYPGVYGYLGQYFDQAYQIDTNGAVTTNTTGILSSYGNFFATEPGPAALVTMPDIDTGARGTCTVYAVSLQLDANHDGNMDLSVTGADATSQANPMEFWINNDNDGTGVGQDITASKLSDSKNEVVQSMRDLEDFARVWICGMPSVDSVDGYQVTLSWQNYTGNPSIKLFAAHEADGGIGYLTDTNIAQNYVGNFLTDSSYGTVSNDTAFIFPGLFFENTGTKHLLFEGVSAGSGELMMTITQNGNTIVQTGVWLDLHDVKDFYERAVITDNTSGAISNWTSSVQVVQPATASALGDDTNLIVLVHGINVANWDWLSQSDTVLKRLYWAGYQGKFVTVDWPCEFFRLWTLLSTDTSVFNRSEVKAYKASSALATYLAQLRARYPSDRLNLLVHSQGNAVVSEAIKQSGVSFDTYILTQGAMPDSAYDVSAPTDSSLLTAEALYGTPESQPMGYRGIYTNFTGHIVNFYNPLDPVLDYWLADQAAAKPDGYLKNLIVPSPYYTYDGTSGWHYSLLGFSYQVTDPQESRAYISRSLTLPIGQSGPESPHGVMQSTVDLNANYKFKDVFPGDHSAQWVWPIQTTLPYYKKILDSIQP